MVLSRSGVRVVLAVLMLAVGLGCSAESKKVRHTERGDAFYSEQKYREAAIEYLNVLRIDQHDPHATRRLAYSYLSLGDAGQAFPHLLKARELYPGDLDVRIKLAGLLTMGGNREEAKKELDFILEKEPGHFDAIQLLATLAISPEDVAEVLDKLEEIREERDHDERYHLTTGNLLARSRDLSGAEASFRTALARNPDSIQAHLALGDLFFLRDDMVGAEREYKAAAELDPLASPVQVRLADFYSAMNRQADARAILTQVTKNDPDFLPAHYRLAEMALTEQEYDECLAILQNVFQRNASDPSARIIRGRVHLARGATPSAMEDFRETIRVQPNSPVGHYYLALAHLQANDAAQARSSLTDALRIHPQFTDAILRLAELEIREGSHRRAIESLETVVSRQPQLPQAHVLLGSAFLATGNASKAIESFQKAKELSPHDPRPPHLLGLALRRENRNSEAERNFHEALDLSPGFMEPLVQLVALDIQARKKDSALERVKTQISLAPQSANLYVLLGRVHGARGETSAAEAAFNKAIETDPNLTTGYLALSQLYISSSEYDQALMRLRNVLEVNPQNLSAAMLSGLIHEKKGDVAMAKEAYEELIDNHPDFAPAANNLAYLYLEHGGDLDKALDLAYRARLQAPEDPHIADTLGWALYKKGRIDQAVTSLRLSANKLPDHPIVQYHLGMAYHKQGNHEAARQALERALRLDPDFDGAHEARSALAELDAS